MTVNVSALSVEQDVTFSDASIVTCIGVGSSDTSKLFSQHAIQLVESRKVTSLSMNPKGYGRYVVLARVRGERPDSKLAKSAARYRFAKNLSRVEITAISSLNEEAYTKALRLSLAYSALEPLIKAKSLNGSISVSSKKNAQLFRGPRLKKFREFLVQHSREDGSKKSLIQMINSTGSADVLPVVVCIRHLMFYGILNPTAASIGTKTALSFLDELAYEVFAEIHRRMLAHLEEYERDAV